MKPFIAFLLALTFVSHAALEKKTVISETYENRKLGYVYSGSAGIDANLGSNIAIVADDAGSGKHALRFTDAPGLKKSYNPHRGIRLSGPKTAREGEIVLEFDIKNSAECPAKFDVEMRDWTSGAFKSLPKLTFSPAGEILANGKRLPFTAKPGNWYHILLSYRLGSKSYDVQFQEAGNAPQIQTVPFSTNAKAMNWLGFVSFNEKKTEFTVDNLKLSIEKEPPPPHELYTDFIMRGNLMRSYRAFAAGGQKRVAFMGGSVTTRQWRGPVMEALEARFPNTEFDFVMAGIGGTGADLGAFRLPEHVFGRGKVDLFFLEFAVNGGGVRAMEGIVRQARRLNPDIDIVIMYFASTGHCKSFEAGKIPGIVQTHEKVAEAYGIPVLYLYREIARRIQEKKIVWADFASDGVHPHQGGCDMYSQCINDFLATAWAKPDLPPATNPTPEKLDPNCFENGHFIPLEEAEVVRGFSRIPKWRVQKTCNFSPPVDVLACTEANSELALDFTGTAIGIYSIIGMDAGIIEYSIDGAPFKKEDQFDHYCPRFHRPQHKLFVTDLKPGKHRIVLRSSTGKNEKSEGNAIRILKFMAN